MPINRSGIFIVFPIGKFHLESGVVFKFRNLIFTDHHHIPFILVYQTVKRPARSRFSIRCGVAGFALENIVYIFNGELRHVLRGQKRLCAIKIKADDAVVLRKNRLLPVVDLVF